MSARRVSLLEASWCFFIHVVTMYRHNAQVGSALRSWTGVDADIGLLPKGDPPNPSTGALYSRNDFANNEVREHRCGVPCVAFFGLCLPSVIVSLALASSRA